MAGETKQARPQIAPKVYEQVRSLLQAGKNDEAIVLLCALNIVRPDDLAIKELLFDAFYEKRNWLPALALADEIARNQPDKPRAQRALIATLSNMKRYDETITRACAYIVKYGEDLTMLDALKVAYFYTGKIEEAVRFGQRALELRDEEACRQPPPVSVTIPATPPQGDNVISYSLWGTAPFYAYGAMINLELARSIYPGWNCRFYVAADVPRACVRYLRGHGGDVRAMEDEYPGVGLFQRFLVMDDRKVGRFLVRDCDARLSVPEADLVKQWIDSGEPFHVVRDHVLHNELMIGCLWAGRTDCGINMVDLMRRYFAAGPNAKYGQDQRMLGLMLWPLIRSHCLVHDKWYGLPGLNEVALKDPHSHFGAGHQNLKAVQEEAEQLGIPRLL